MKTNQLSYPEYVTAWRNLKVRIETEMYLKSDIIMYMDKVEEAIYRLEGLEQ